MMLFAFVLSCMMTGSFACSDNRCKDSALSRELMEINFLPNKEELRTFCPQVMSFLECQKDFLECPGQSLEELATSSDILEAGKANAMKAAIGLVRDICDEDSSFHDDYVASAVCLREYFSGPARNCRDEVSKPVDEFLDHVYEEDGENVFGQMLCLRDAYEMVCIINNLEDTCGDVAQRTVRNALERLNPALGLRTCKSLKNSSNLKARFLDFLELDEQKRSEFEDIFGLFKRK